MSEELISQLNQVMAAYTAQTTDRMVLTLVFMLAIAFIVDRGIALLARRGEDKGEQAMLKLMTTISTTNARLHEATQAATERYSAMQAATERHNRQSLKVFARSINALTKSNETVGTAVEALDGRTNFLISQGQRLELGINAVNKVLTEGKTSTAVVMGEKMETLEARLSAVEGKLAGVESHLAAVEDKLDRVIAFMEKLDHLNQTVQEVVHKGGTGPLDAQLVGTGSVPDAPETKK